MVCEQDRGREALRQSGCLLGEEESEHRVGGWLRKSKSGGQWGLGKVEGVGYQRGSWKVRRRWSEGADGSPFLAGRTLVKAREAVTWQWGAEAWEEVSAGGNAECGVGAPGKGREGGQRARCEVLPERAVGMGGWSAETATRRGRAVGGWQESHRRRNGLEMALRRRQESHHLWAWRSLSLSCPVVTSFKISMLNDQITDFTKFIDVPKLVSFHYFQSF